MARALENPTHSVPRSSRRQTLLVLNPCILMSMVPTTVARVHPCAIRPRRNDSGASNRNFSSHSWILGPRTAAKAGTSTKTAKPHHSSAARRLYATPNPLIESSDSPTNTTNTSPAPPKTRRVVFAVDGTPASEQGLAWLARNILLKSTVGIIKLDRGVRSLVSPRSPLPSENLSRTRSFARQDVVHLANVVCDSCAPSTGVGSFSSHGAQTQWAPSRHVLDSALSLRMTNARVSPHPTRQPLSPCAHSHRFAQQGRAVDRQGGPIKGQRRGDRDARGPLQAPAGDGEYR